MTREDLTVRIASLSEGIGSLKQQIAQGEAQVGILRGNLAMTTGALEECKHWLEKLNTLPEAPVETFGAPLKKLEIVT